MKDPVFSRVLLAVDDTPCSEKAIDYTIAIIERMPVSLAIVSVVPPTSPSSYGADPLLGQQPVIVPEVSQIQQESAQEYLEQVAQRFPPTKEVFVFTRIGSVRDEILATAKEWSSDLIILGSNGRTGFDHLLSGSVSESVIRKANCPVLVIPGKCE